MPLAINHIFCTQSQQHTIVPSTLLLLVSFQISSFALPLQVGVLGLSLYNVTNALLMLKAWYALFVYGLVPLGVIFFSFAAGCAIKGVFSLLLGNLCCLDLGRIWTLPCYAWRSLMIEMDSVTPQKAQLAIIAVQQHMPLQHTQCVQSCQTR